MIDCIENILCPRADYGWDHFNDSFTDSEMNYALDNRCCLLDFLCEGVSALVNLAIFICRAVVLVFMCLAAAVITGVEYLVSRLINSFWIWNYLFPPEEVFPIETLEGKEERLGERDQLSRRVPQELIGCILEYAGVKGYQTLACVNRRLYYRVNEEALMLGFDRRYYGMCNEVSHLVLQTQALRLGGGQLRRDCQNGLCALLYPGWNESLYEEARYLSTHKNLERRFLQQTWFGDQHGCFHALVRELPGGYVGFNAMQILELHSLEELNSLRCSQVEFPLARGIVDGWSFLVLKLNVQYEGSDTMGEELFVMRRQFFEGEGESSYWYDEGEPWSYRFWERARGIWRIGFRDHTHQRVDRDTINLLVSLIAGVPLTERQIALCNQVEEGRVMITRSLS